MRFCKIEIKAENVGIMQPMSSAYGLSCLALGECVCCARIQCPNKTRYTTSKQTREHSIKKNSGQWLMHKLLISSFSSCFWRVGANISAFLHRPCSGTHLSLTGHTAQNVSNCWNRVQKVLNVYKRRDTQLCEQQSCASQMALRNVEYTQKHVIGTGKAKQVSYKQMSASKAFAAVCCSLYTC